jgi:hypothetical protein
MDDGQERARLRGQLGDGRWMIEFGWELSSGEWGGEERDGWTRRSI